MFSLRFRCKCGGNCCVEAKDLRTVQGDLERQLATARRRHRDAVASRDALAGRVEQLVQDNKDMEAAMIRMRAEYINKLTDLGIV